jgi:hypothetical protein
MAQRIYAYFSYDGETDLPEEGVADFRGSPHYFWLRQCSAEPKTGLFDLAPISPEILALVNERQEIWHQWDLAYHAGEVELATHPARTGNHPRYLELSEQLAQRVATLPSTATAVSGTVGTTQEYLERMRPFAGQKWPVPGTYSPELEVTWFEEL